MASRSPSSPRLSDGGGARTDMAAASSSTSRSLLLQLVADDAGRRRPLCAPDRRLHPREADGVAVRHCRRPPARHGAPLSDPPPPKLDPKIGSPSLREALPPVLSRRRLHPREADGVAARHPSLPPPSSSSPLSSPFRPSSSQARPQNRFP